MPLGATALPNPRGRRSALAGSPSLVRHAHLLPLHRAFHPSLSSASVALHSGTLPREPAVPGSVRAGGAVLSGARIRISYDCVYTSNE